MTPIGTNLHKPTYVFSKQKKLLLALLGTIFSLIIFLFVLTPSAAAQGSGGVGGAGSGGGGSGGHQSVYGHSWALYAANGPGPSNGFRDGTSWSYVRSICRNSTVVVAYIVRNSSQQAKVYDYVGWTSNVIPHGTSIDGGRAIAISVSAAQSTYYTLPAHLRAGYSFGSNVAWFCYGSTGPTANCAIYGPTSVSAGQSFQASIHFGNPSGSGYTWNPSQGYRIGSQSPQDNTRWGTRRLALTGVIAPGGTSWGGPYNFTAPTSPGTYAFSWQMLQEGVQWFGNICTQYITVTAPQPVFGATCAISGAPTSIRVGQSFNASIRFTNPSSSSLTWNPSQGYRIGSQNPTNNSYWGAYRLALTGVIPPGGTSYGSYNFTAPSTPGTYAFSWRMLQENVQWFGNTCTQYITVTAPPPPPPITISGRVWDVATGVNYANVSIATCGHGNATTASNGTFSFVVPQGASFCVSINSNPSGTWGSPHIRPWGEGYGPSCRAYTTTAYTGRLIPDDYCAQTRYDSQVAGQHGASPDRASNGGYDLVYDTPPPKATCSISVSPSTLEVGRPFTVTVTVDRRTGSHPSEPPINNSGSGAYRARLYILPTPGLTGLPSNSLNYGTVVPGGTGSISPLTGVQAATPNIYVLRAELRDLPGGTVQCNNSSNPGGPPGTSVEVGNKSYLKVYGGEVATGGSFYNGTACPAPGQGSINAWAEPRGGASYAGASAQLTISSLLEINELYSAAQRTATPTAPKGLTFANTGSSAANSTYGGGSGHVFCLIDYFNETRDNTINEGSWSGNGNQLNANTGRVQYELNGPNIGSSGPITVYTGTQMAVYVDRDVTIRNNIVYDGASSWEVSPNFVLIVRGNIYIDRSVTRLDGTYIAQPGVNGAGPGRIYTCASNGSAIPAASIHGQCHNQLVINGALIAQSIRFLRTNGTLVNAVVREQPNSSGIAEVINYTPEMYLAPSPLKRPGAAPGSTSAGTASGVYDSLKTLPPAF